ncbi:hypothetical protein A2U01_0118881, partial [Trifolium medium]|nr:hypothetical protein [Trifolium medium]
MKFSSGEQWRRVSELVATSRCKFAQRTCIS